MTTFSTVRCDDSLPFGVLGGPMFLAISPFTGSVVLVICTDGSADAALPGALPQASATDPTAQSQPVARRYGEATGVCFNRQQRGQQ